jgi:hypothetical protein
MSAARRQTAANSTARAEGWPSAPLTRSHAALALAGTALLASLASAPAQGLYSRREEPLDPEWLRFKVTEVSLGMYAEGQFNNATYKDSNTRVTHNRFFVGPLLGLNFEGSIWHPKLFAYNVASEGAFGWSWDTVTVSGQPTTKTKEADYLGAFNATGLFLQGKPYATTAFANYNHTFRQYDFFNQVTVDSWRYGLNSGYVADNWSVNGSYWHRDEQTYGFAQQTDSHEDVVSLDGRYQRDRGTTAANYGYNQFSRVDYGQVGTGVNQNISVSDTENFGRPDQYRLFTTASWAELDQSELPSTQWIGNANFEAEHSDVLKSRYNFNYDQYNTTDYVSHNYLGHAELQHQLYDSLTSTLIGEGTAFNFDSPLSTSTQTRFTGGFSHAYIKKLSETATLNLDNTLLGSYTTVETTGNVVSIFDERHSFAVNGAAPPDSFFLDRTRVVQTSIVVTDDRNTIPPFREGLDYRVNRIGIQTAIQRLPGSRIAPGSTVFVDYQALATPSGSYGTLTEAFRARVSLYNDMWGLYGRLALSLNNAPDDMFVQNIRTYAVGTDFQRAWLRVGAEYEIYDATLSRYDAWNFYQQGNWDIDGSSTFGANFSQTFAYYYDPDRSDNLYTFILRYNRALSWQLSYTIEGGVSLRRGFQVDQTLATCRPLIEWRRGRSSIRLSYDFEHSVYLDNEIRNQHLFALRFRRVL